MDLKLFMLIRLVILFVIIMATGCAHVTLQNGTFPKVSVEVRVCQDVPSPNCREMGVHGSMNHVCVGQETYFTNSDIEHAKAETAQYTVMKNTVISLKLTADGSEKYARFTKDNYNKSVAIIFDGKVMSHPIIRETITSGVIYFTGQFTLEEAEVFVKGINGY